MEAGKGRRGRGEGRRRREEEEETCVMTKADQATSSLECPGLLGLGWRYRRWRMQKGTSWSTTLLPLYLHPSPINPYPGGKGGKEEGKEEGGKEGGGGGGNLCFAVRSN